MEKSNEELVLEAVASLGDKLYACPPREVSQKVCERALMMRRQADQRSLAMRTLAATPIPCRVKSVTFEESTSRYLVEFVALKGDGGTEQIRSDRTDGSLGPVVQRMWGGGLAGHRAVVYKLNEPGKDAKASNGYRVAPWVVDLGLMEG